MYTYHADKGEVIRNADGAIVMPIEDTQCTLYLEYKQWIDSGNYPTVIQELKRPYIITMQAFRDRFTGGEQLSILNAAYAGDEPCRLLMFKLQTSQDVDVNSDTVINGVNYLHTIGLISLQRTEDLLAK